MLADVQRSCCVHQQMDIHKLTSNAQACGEQAASKTPTQPQWQPQTPSGATAVQAASIVVVRRLHEAKPQPPQTFKPAGFLARVQKQKAEGRSEERRVGKECRSRW